jgi:AcrR family transcriptional regulator
MRFINEVYMQAIDQTQVRLLQSAGTIFAAKGFDGATVREICQQARANTAAVNYYFRDKERLYIEAVKSALDIQAAEIRAPNWPANTPAQVKLRGFIHTILGNLFDPNSPAWHRQLILRELAQPTAACAELVQDRIRPFAVVLMQILNELLPSLTVRRRQLIAFSIVGQCVYHRMAKPIVELLVGPEEYRNYDAELLSEHIAQFSLAALGLEKPILEREHTPTAPSPAQA